MRPELLKQIEAEKQKERERLADKELVARMGDKLPVKPSSSHGNAQGQPNNLPPLPSKGQ